MPSISLLLDRDTDKEIVIKYPHLYKPLLKGRELNTKNFLWWLFKSVLQAGIIMFGSMILFPDKLFLKIVTVTFTSLIYLEILNIYMEINKWHFFMAFALAGTFLLYTLCIVFLSNYISIYYIFDLDTMWRVAAVSIVAWFPFFLINKINKLLNPTTTDKLEKAKSIEDDGSTIISLNKSTLLK